MRNAFLVMVGTFGLFGWCEESFLIEQKLSLEQVLDKALSKHYSINLAEIKLQLAKVGQAKSIQALLPKLHLDGGYTRNSPEVKRNFTGDTTAQEELYRQVSSLLIDGGKGAEAEKLIKQADILKRRNNMGDIVINPKDVFLATISLEVPLFNGPNLVRAFSGHPVNIAKARLLDEKTKTIYQVFKSYYSILYLKDLVAAKKQALATLSKRFSQKRSGEEAERIKAHLLLREAEVKSTENELIKALDELGLMMGISDKFTLDEEPHFSLPELPTEGLVDSALANRLDLKAEKEAVLSAKNEGLARFMRFFPEITLLGSANYSSNNKGFLGEHYFYSMSINASLSLFEGGQTFSDLKEAALKRQASELSVDHLEKEIRININSRIERIKVLKLKEEAYIAYQKASAQTLRVASDSFNRGKMSLREFLRADEEQSQADAQLKKLQLDLINEQLALSYEAGLLTSNLP